MNKVILIGRVTKDIELKTTPTGKSVVLFTLAVNRNHKNADGNYDADFINCVAYDMRAETIRQYVHKGDKFGIDGRLKTRTFDRQDGSKAYVTEVIVDGFEFLENKKDKPTEAESYSNTEDFEPIENDGDLPF